MITVKIILQVSTKYGIIANMSSLIKKAFDITKENLIIAQPLILFLIILMFTTSTLMQQTNKYAYVIFLIANLLLCTAFLAGWFYMIIKAIAHNKKAENGEYKNNQEKTEASMALGKEFFPGVGDYFLPMTFTMLFYIAVYLLILFVSFKAGLKFIPHPQLNWVEFMTAANSTPVEMQKYVSTLSFTQLKSLNLWMFYMGGIASIFSFLTMFLFPAVYDKKEFFFLAPFSSFNRNLIFIFKNLFGAIGIIIFLFFLNLVISLLSLFFSVNIVLSVVGLLLTFYFMTYAIVLIFLYYEDKK